MALFGKEFKNLSSFSLEQLGGAAYCQPVEAETARRAVATCLAIAVASGLSAVDAVVLSNSNRLVVRLLPCDVLARVAPRSRRRGAELEVGIARSLAGTSVPLAGLHGHFEPRVYEDGGFVVTFWNHFASIQPNGLSADEYAGALEHLHAGMRNADLSGVSLPHFLDRVDEAQSLVDDHRNNSEIAGPDRELLATTLRTMSRAIIDRDAPEQLLHGEPHPGNLLRTSSGLLFVDLETCCRGPVEFDIAHAAIDAIGPPLRVAARYRAADRSLVRDCWRLVLAMVTAWRCEPGDDLPNGSALAKDWIRQLRATHS